MMKNLVLFLILFMFFSCSDKKHEVQNVEFRSSVRVQESELVKVDISIEELIISRDYSLSTESLLIVLQQFPHLVELKIGGIKSEDSIIFNLNILSKLKVLDLSRNNLTKFPDLRGMNIERLELHHNLIEQVEKECLKDCFKLEEINLDFNQISDSFFIKKLSGLKTLKYIRVGENKLISLRGLNELEQLQEISLYQTYVCCLEQDLKVGKSLKHIKLSVLDESYSKLKSKISRPSILKSSSQIKCNTKDH